MHLHSLPSVALLSIFTTLASADCTIQAFSSPGCKGDAGAVVPVAFMPIGHCMLATNPERHSIMLGDGCPGVQVNYFEGDSCGLFPTQENWLEPGCHDIDTGSPVGSAFVVWGYPKPPEEQPWEA